MASGDIETRVRRICLALPEVEERTSHGSPAFFVKRQFVMLWADGHHDHDFPHLWAAAPSGLQAAMVADDPRRFFVPPYVGGRGWIGMRLDGRVDWGLVASVCEDAYRTIAPKKLPGRLDEPSAPPATIRATTARAERWDRGRAPAAPPSSSPA